MILKNIINSFKKQYNKRNEISKLLENKVTKICAKITFRI